MLPGIWNTLLKDYTATFHPFDGRVHQQGRIHINLSSKVILQLWWDANGLWHVPIQEQSTDVMQNTALIAHPSLHPAVHNAYELPSMNKLIYYLPVAAGFSTKIMWLTAI